MPFLLKETKAWFRNNGPLKWASCINCKSCFRHVTIVDADFSNNSFTGSIPDSLGNLRNLRRLFFSKKFLASSAPELSFVTSLTNCRNLASLEFGYNPLSNRLPISVGNLSASSPVSFADSCATKGSVPKEIGNLSNLVKLVLEDNELTGTIPSTIWTLGQLQGLYLAGNRLQGSMPRELCQLERLVSLSLMENSLSGSTIPCSNNFPFRRGLYLASNKFSGDIPSTLWRLQDILELDLSSNTLNSSLPLEIENLKVVTAMDLSRNQLSGNIPDNIGGLKGLNYLSLSRNRFQDHIPQSVRDLVGLKVLDLSINNLSGEIPKSLENLKFLSSLNLSFNQLQGAVPDGGKLGSFSATSFQGNEALCDSARRPFPPCRLIAPHSKTSSMFLFRYILPIVGHVLQVLAFLIIFRRYRKQKAILPKQESSDLEGWKRASYLQLELATNGFQESNLLGTGSFGSVYKGTLSDGMNIAVKGLNLQIERPLSSFDTECEVLRNLRHGNLVKIISSCCNLDFKALVLEVMPNWNLEKWLYSHNYFLDVTQKLKIMVDVASALEYLHHGYTIPAVHCDLKPRNTLLGHEMVAHASDFGIAKLLGEDSVIQTMALGTTGYMALGTTGYMAPGTIGYMAPGCWTEGFVSIKGDVYSCGILLMETFTGKRPADEMFVEEVNIKHWVGRPLPFEIKQLVDDANLLRTGEEHCVAEKESIISIMELGLQCSAD